MVDELLWIISYPEKALVLIGTFFTGVAFALCVSFLVRKYLKKKEPEENVGGNRPAQELQPHEEFVVREFERARSLLQSGRAEEAMQHLVNAVEVKVLLKPYDMLRLLRMHLSPPLFEMLCVRLHLSRRDKGVRRVR